MKPEDLKLLLILAVVLLFPIVLVLKSCETTDQPRDHLKSRQAACESGPAGGFISSPC